ncbi:MAG: YidC/Oxa1 family membrane protein insertase [Firmicutes bacterium]|nr:YidC/Oxa1 family membrane protein insertase [Bacillota bacterium]
MLNIFISAITALASSTNTLRAPRGMWEWFLLTVFGFIQNYGWRIIVFTIILKLVLSPLDFYQRYKMRKNQAITEKIKPELEKLEKQHKDDKRGYQAAQMQLQKAHGFSHFSACLPMILTLVVFFTFFAGMQNVSRFHEFSEYLQMHNVYQARFRQLTDFEAEYFDSEEEFRDYILGWFNQEHEWIRRPDGDMTPAQTEALNFFNAHDGQFSQVMGALDSIREHVNFVVGGQGQRHLFIVAAPVEWPANWPSRNELISAGYFNWDRLIAMTESNVQGIQYVQNYVIAAVNYNIASRNEYPKLPFDIPSSFDLNRQGFDDIVYERQVFDILASAQRSVNIFLDIASIAAAYEVMNMYAEYIRTDFLWIRSIWLPDTPWARPVSDFNAFRNRVGNRYLGDRPPEMEDGSYMDSYLHRELASERFYNDITRMVRANEDLNRSNGFLILAILAIGLSFGSQILTRQQQKKSGQIPGGMPGMGGAGGAAGGGMMMKVMGFMMPAMIGIFALFQSSAFALYMITNSLMTLVINLGATLIINKMFNKREGVGGSKKSSGGVNSDGVQRYGRPDPTQFNK